MSSGRLRKKTINLSGNTQNLFLPPRVCLTVQAKGKHGSTPSLALIHSGCITTVLWLKYWDSAISAPPAEVGPSDTGAVTHLQPVVGSLPGPPSHFHRLHICTRIDKQLVVKWTGAEGALSLSLSLFLLRFFFFVSAEGADVSLKAGTGAFAVTSGNRVASEGSSAG